MRTTLALSLLALVAAGCKSQKVIEVETEITAAKGRVASLEKKRQELTAELKRLQVERKMFGQQADEAALAKERLYAASFALAQQPLPDGIQLDEALREKSPTLGKLAAAIVQRQLPCADPDAEQPSDADGPSDCSAPPLIDSCDGVSETFTQSFSWRCQTLAANGKVPGVALCLSKAELATNDYPLDAPTSHLEGEVVRMAYEKAGRLMVADWPPPSRSIYEPENWAELATCHAENDNAQCIRSCDEKWGKVGGCDWGDDGYEGEGGDADGDEEPYELRAAREAAERAEREAQEARDELAYQECIAGCGSPETEEEELTKLSLEYRSSPAPGLYQFAVKGQNEEGKVTESNTLLVSFLAMHDELAGDAEKPEADTVGELTTVLNVRKIIEGKVADGQRVLAGLTLNDTPVAARISMDGKAPPVTLDLDQTCAFADETKNAQLQERCVVAKKQRDEQKAKAEALAAAEAAKKAARLDGGVDAGTVVATPTPASVDAGVKP
jgi:hypothetical protein